MQYLELKRKWDGSVVGGSKQSSACSIQHQEKLNVFASHPWPVLAPEEESVAGMPVGTMDGPALGKHWWEFQWLLRQA